MSMNPFGARATLTTNSGPVDFFRLRKLAEDKLGDIETLPYSIRVLLEACLRNVDGFTIRPGVGTQILNEGAGLDRLESKLPAVMPYSTHVGW